MSISTTATVGTIALGAAIGIGTAVAVRPLFRDWRDHVIEGRFDDHEHERAKLKAGDSWTPFAPYTDQESYSDAMLSVGALFATGGACAFGVHLLSKGKAAAGAGMIALAGGLLGATVGGIVGGTQGGRAATARHGIDVDDQVAEVFNNFDADRSGDLDLTDANGHMPEYMRRNTSSQPYYHETPGWDSIERAARRADSNHDDKVSHDELHALLDGFDSDKDGVLAKHDVQEFSRAGLEGDLLMQIIR